MPARRFGRTRDILVLLASLVLLSACGRADVPSDLMAAGAGGRFWPSAGHDLDNSRHASTENRIAPDTVSDLAVRWALNTSGPVTATPSVDATSLYVPDGAGQLYRIDRKTGAVQWTVDVAALTGIAGNVSATTPTLHDGMIVVGDQGGRAFAGARVHAFDKATGQLLWSTVVDDHPAAIVSQSPIVFGSVLVVGVDSLEDVFAADPAYPCCTFRGSAVALDADTGAILWRTFMAPAGFSGAAVRGSTPSVDPSRRTVYVTTDANYSVPPDVSSCVAANAGDDTAIAACLPPDDLFDAIVALDIETGALLWSTRTAPFDAWTSACLASATHVNCPDPSGDGQGFAQGPMLFETRLDRGRPFDAVGAGTKRGEFWTLDRDSGQIAWITQAGPGGTRGGLRLGSAVDSERIYVAVANSDAVSTVLADGVTTTSGFWSALDAATGEVLWQTVDPLGGSGASLDGPVTVANGVVFGCSLDPAGTMHALDAATGETLWNFASGTPCLGGAAVVGGSLYWGTGTDLAPNGKLFAFEPLN